MLLLYHAKASNDPVHIRKKQVGRFDSVLYVIALVEVVKAFVVSLMQPPIIKESPK